LVLKSRSNGDVMQAMASNADSSAALHGFASLGVC